MGFTSVWFFQNQDIQAKVEYEAAKRNIPYAKFVADLVTDFIAQKWKQKIDAKNSRQFYFICQEYAAKSKMPIAAFIEDACAEMLGEKTSFWSRVSQAMDLNRDAVEGRR